AMPEVQGFNEEKTSEVRFIVPGSMVCNLDFVESIFGNGDNPDLAENDAALDPEHWTGTSGLVVLAPHLIKVKAKDVGLPHKSQASERQLSDGLYYEKDDDLYNGGSAFKITARDSRGVVVTIIADNYFGYCKKEVKTQLGYAANVHGMAEEEHAGGTIAYPSFDLGEELAANAIGKIAPGGNAAYLGSTHKYLSETAKSRTFDDALKILKDTVEIQPEVRAHLGARLKERALVQRCLRGGAGAMWLGCPARHARIHRLAVLCACAHIRRTWWTWWICVCRAMLAR
ncbi:MAG: hypothetical protein ACPIOQ_32345, partial [Promethearchaeia archaeon]